METILAEFNHGRWICFCPVCREEGMIVAMETAAGEIFVCPQEYPNLLATMLVPNARVQGALNAVPDEGLRAETRQQAMAAGKGYEVVFPADQKEIERVLRERPVAARNWSAPTTVDELRRENAAALRGVKQHA